MYPNILFVGIFVNRIWLIWYFNSWKNCVYSLQYRSIRISSKIWQSDHKWKNHSWYWCT